MKVAGIIRRIDELGRIVIPKEIRKTLHIKNGENLEIYIENGNVVLKKYSELKSFKELSDTIAISLNQITKSNILISDMDNFISAEGSFKKKYLNKEISEDILKIINNRKSVVISNKSLNITKENKEKSNIIVNPIISNGDAVGSILIINKNENIEEYIESINLATNILAKHIES